MPDPLIRLGDASAADSARVLLEAVVAMSTDLDLRRVLQRIVASAAQLTAAQYGALGIVGDDGRLVEFLTTGIDDADRERIGDPPRGHGILGLLIHHPQPLRLSDLTAHPESRGWPPGHPPMKSFLGVPVRIRGTVFGNLYLTQKRGSDEFSESDEVLVEALATAAGFVIENARAYGLSERRRQWLEASAELLDRLQPPIASAEALGRLGTAIRQVSRARAVALITPTDDDPIVLSADAADVEWVTAGARELSATLPAAVGEPVEASYGDFRAVALPLRAQLAAGGLLTVFFDRQYNPAADEERQLLASFADQAGLALDRAEAIANRQELAVVTDRERIARDLHDVVIQRLFATGLELQGVSQLSPAPQVTERLGRAVEALDQTIRDIRGTIFELHHSGTDTLRTAIRELTDEYAEVLGFMPQLRIRGPVDNAVPAPVAEQVVAVLREALSNVARHAGARSTRIHIDASAHEFVLTVVDDGKGIRRGASESGLRNARARAESLGGTLTLTANDPHGTAFSWRVPLV